MSCPRRSRRWCPSGCERGARSATPSTCRTACSARRHGPLGCGCGRPVTARPTSTVPLRQTLSSRRRRGGSWCAASCVGAGQPSPQTSRPGPAPRRQPRGSGGTCRRRARRGPRGRQAAVDAHRGPGSSPRRGYPYDGAPVAALRPPGRGGAPGTAAAGPRGTQAGVARGRQPRPRADGRRTRREWRHRKQIITLAPFTPLSRKEQQAIRDEAMRTMTDFAVAFDH